jgi:squalene cyclase
VQGLKAALALAQLPLATVGEPIQAEGFCDAVNVILSYQNSDGGWPTYELKRSFSFVELLNPAETFGDIMVDYSYVECSSACMTALSAFQKQYPKHRAKEISAAIARGKQYIQSIQRPDGSWCVQCLLWRMASIMCSRLIQAPCTLMSPLSLIVTSAQEAGHGRRGDAGCSCLRALCEFCCITLR